MPDTQDRVQRTINRLVESGAERGIQVAAYRSRDQIVDAVAGIADPATGRAVTADTPFYNFSIGKGVTATIAHLLAEHGAFAYRTPVAELWPEFAAHGKDSVTVWHVLSHTAGVPGLPLDSTVEDVCDWDHICSAIADAELWWEPASRMGYHAYSFGFIVGEIVRRATGRRISQVLLDDVAKPLGVGDQLRFGIPETEQGRLAVLEDAPRDPDAPDPFADMPADLPMFKAGPMTLMPTAELGNRPDMLAADIPAGGKTSAGAIAKMYAALLGNIEGVHLVSPDRLRQATEVAFSGQDEVFGTRSTWGLGYALGGPADWTNMDTFGMAGAGGSWAGADRSTGLVVAVTKNVLSDDFQTVGTIASLIAG